MKVRTERAQHDGLQMTLPILHALVACSNGNTTEVVAARPESTPGLCVTRGRAEIGAIVTDPAMRAIKIGSSGEAATLIFALRGKLDSERALASGSVRRQLGLKLRAQNGCNVVYVMWRLDPKPAVEVSVKRNPGAVTYKDCGANGYTKIKPIETGPLPDISDVQHTLRAQIASDQLRAWIDGNLVWRGTLPDAEFGGPAGMRSDNLAFELIAFDAPTGQTQWSLPKCVVDETAD